MLYNLNIYVDHNLNKAEDKVKAEIKRKCVFIIQRLSLSTVERLEFYGPSSTMSSFLQEL